MSLYRISIAIQFTWVQPGSHPYGLWLPEIGVPQPACLGRILLMMVVEIWPIQKLANETTRNEEIG